MKRVMIVGQPGSGKSTLARAMGDATGLPVYHMDMIHWKPGWEERPLAEKIPMAHAIEAKSNWIFEGGLSSTYQNRLSRADTLIVLDLPLLLRAWRVFWRTLPQHGQSRPDLPANCPERFDREFWSYIWRTRKSGRARVLEFMAQAGPGTEIHRLRAPSQAREYLQSVGANADAYAHS